MHENFLFALSLTLFAGLATGIGSVIALCTNRAKPETLSPTLGFSAGVMLYVSFVEIFPKGLGRLALFFPGSDGYQIATLAFFFGVTLTALIDRLIPAHGGNPHELPTRGELSDVSLNHPEKHQQNHLLRMGLFTALAITLHNFPEGFATFAAAISDPKLGTAIAFAIAIHNIPEGIAVSIPIYYATGSKGKAFVASLLSGLAEPIGALFCYVIVSQWITDTNLLLGVLFPIIAGIMVFISLDELLPAAEEYGEHHVTIYSVFAGMFVMALSLMLL